MNKTELSPVMQQTIQVAISARWVVAMHLGGVKNLDAALETLHKDILFLDELAGISNEQVAA